VERGGPHWGSLQHTPRSPSCIYMGPTSKGRGEKGKGMGEERGSSSFAQGRKIGAYDYQHPHSGLFWLLAVPWLSSRDFAKFFNKTDWTLHLTPTDRHHSFTWVHTHALGLPYNIGTIASLGCARARTHACTHTHTHLFNGPFSGPDALPATQPTASKH